MIPFLLYFSLGQVKYQYFPNNTTNMVDKPCEDARHNEMCYSLNTTYIKKGANISFYRWNLIGEGYGCQMLTSDNLEEKYNPVFQSSPMNEPMTLNECEESCKHETDFKNRSCEAIGWNRNNRCKLFYSCDITLHYDHWLHSSSSRSIGNIIKYNQLGNGKWRIYKPILVFNDYIIKSSETGNNSTSNSTDNSTGDNESVSASEFPTYGIVLIVLLLLGVLTVVCINKNNDDDTPLKSRDIPGFENSIYGQVSAC